MPRAGQRKPLSDARLTDHVAIGVLTRVFPPELVDGVVVEVGRREQRQRLLPARVVVYYVLALALFSDCSYEEVMRQLVEGLAWESGWEQVWEVPSKMAISKARCGVSEFATERPHFLTQRWVVVWDRFLLGKGNV